MLNDLEEIITYIEHFYHQIRNEWKVRPEYRSFNLSNKQVVDVTASSRCPELLHIIFNYRAFLSESIISVGIMLSLHGCASRVKNQNSIENKLAVYCTPQHQFGTVPLQKCLNDLFGIRYILKDSMNLDELTVYIREKYPHLKCTKSQKNGYKAVHVYFKEDNYDFPWELQIWNPEDEVKNKELHKKYKQSYTSWEKETKKEVK